MYQKEALSSLIAKIRDDKDHGEKDLDLLRETCLNACTCAYLTGRAKILARYDGAGSEAVSAAKNEKGDILHRLEYNLIAANALAAYYDTEPIFAGDPHSADISAFCSEFSSALQKQTRQEG